MGVRPNQLKISTVFALSSLGYAFITVLVRREYSSVKRLVNINIVGGGAHFPEKSHMTSKIPID
jgi:hypothetical protein